MVFSEIISNWERYILDKLNITGRTENRIIKKKRTILWYPSDVGSHHGHLVLSLGVQKNFAMVLKFRSAEIARPLYIMLRAHLKGVQEFLIEWWIGLTWRR